MKTIEVYRKNFPLFADKDFCDYLTIEIIVPEIAAHQTENHMSGTGYIFNLGFPTQFCFSKDEISWGFSLCVLGLGVSVYRQWGY